MNLDGKELHLWFLLTSYERKCSLSSELRRQTTVEYTEITTLQWLVIAQSHLYFFEIMVALPKILLFNAL